MADLKQANKLLSMGRQRSQASPAELAIARQKFWDAVDNHPDDELMLIGADRDSEIRRFKAERDAYHAENAALHQIKIKQQREIAELRHNQSTQTGERFARMYEQLQRECQELREELRFRDQVPRPPPVPYR